MRVRSGSERDYAAVGELQQRYVREFWRRPFPPGPWRDEYLAGTHVLVAEEDGRSLGVAWGALDVHRTGHVNFVYVLPEARGRGVGKALLRGLCAHFREQGAEHVTLSVDTANQQAVAVWQRLGFSEFARSLSAPLESLERRLVPEREERSFGSIHVRTDDVDAVGRAVRQFVARLPGNSKGSAVVPPRNGWVTVYDELCDREPAALRRLARELSDRLGAVVLALGVEHGVVVRYVLLERGRVMDEYVSVPEYHGRLPPGERLRREPLGGRAPDGRRPRQGARRRAHGGLAGRPAAGARPRRGSRRGAGRRGSGARLRRCARARGALSLPRR